jgi:predicted O-methyltransferase YrrM
MNKIDTSIYDNLELLPEDTRGWNGDHNFFHKIIDDVKPSLIVEVGTWKGLSAINMGKHILHKQMETKIICIDTWLGAIEFWDSLAGTNERNLLLKNGYPQIYYQFLSNVVHNGLQDVILPFPNTSDNGFRYLSAKNLIPDLIYIDASHEEEDVYRDVKNYYSVLKKGGVIFGDDFNNWVGVREAINRFKQDQNVNYELIDGNFWVIRKG